MYGLEAFTCEVLHDGITDRGVLNVLEIALIEAHDAYRNGYNQHPGGQDEYRTLTLGNMQKQSAVFIAKN